MTVEIFEGMILAENPHVSSEHSLASETLQMSRLTNGEAEISLHKPNNQVQCQGSNGRCGNLGFDGMNGRPCRDENCGKEDIGVSSRDASTDVLSVSGAFTHIQKYCFLEQTSCFIYPKMIAFTYGTLLFCRKRQHSKRK